MEEGLSASASPALDQADIMTPLQQYRDSSDIFSLLYPKSEEGRFYSSITDADARSVYKHVNNRQQKKERILILLDTPGGNVYAAVKIIDTLRQYYKHISVAVPEEAMSSGTMLCLGSDELVMGPLSVLGPLDKPMPHPNNEANQISALDIVRSLDNTIETAIDKQKSLAHSLVRDFGLNKHQALQIAGESMAQLFAPLLSKEDSKTYHEARRMLVIPEILGKDLLKRYMLKSLPERLRPLAAEHIMERLIWLYPDHGYAIRRQELRSLFFNITDAESCPWWPELWSYFYATVGIKKPAIIEYI